MAAVTIKRIISSSSRSAFIYGPTRQCNCILASSPSSPSSFSASPLAPCPSPSLVVVRMNSTHQTLTPSDSEVVLERIANKGIITLNRPKALNALNLSMINVIYPQLRKWEMDDTMKMVLIKGTGDRAFCSGGDVKTIALKGRDDPYGVDFFRNEYRLNNQIGSLSIPYVALLNGITMGGGVGLSVHGAFRVATEKAVFAMPETAIGFFPDVGGSHFLPRLPGKLGLFLALTGHRLEGRDLYKAGVATHFISSARLPDLEKDLLRLENPNLQSIHQMLSKYQEQWEAEHYKEFSLKPYIGRINSAFGASSVEGIVDNLNKDSSEWAKQQLERLQTFSPTSLKVTFEQMKIGSQLSLADCLRMEYKMALNFLQNNDFFEGVRAALIDKDKNPKWKPSSLQEVSQETVESYFKALPNHKDLPL